MLIQGTTVSQEAFESGTGWDLKPEGACRGDVCIPLRNGAHDPATGTIDVVAIADQMGLPIVTDGEHGVAAVGPWSGTGRALVSADAPELVLPDVEGREFRLSSLRGQKVLILSWAPY